MDIAWRWFPVSVVLCKTSRAFPIYSILIPRPSRRPRRRPTHWKNHLREYVPPQPPPAISRIAVFIKLDPSKNHSSFWSPTSRALAILGVLAKNPSTFSSESSPM